MNGRLKNMKASRACDSAHYFTLTLTAVTELTTETENALFEAGCDDATLSARNGKVFLMFTRIAATRDEAISSAIRDVNKANLNVDGALPILA